MQSEDEQGSLRLLCSTFSAGQYCLENPGNVSSESVGEDDENALI